MAELRLGTPLPLTEDSVEYDFGRAYRREWVAAAVLSVIAVAVGIAALVDSTGKSVMGYLFFLGPFMFSSLVKVSYRNRSFRLIADKESLKVLRKGAVEQEIAWRDVASLDWFNKMQDTLTLVGHDGQPIATIPMPAEAKAVVSADLNERLEKSSFRRYAEAMRLTSFIRNQVTEETFPPPATPGRIDHLLKKIYRFVILPLVGVGVVLGWCLRPQEHGLSPALFKLAVASNVPVMMAFFSRLLWTLEFQAVMGVRVEEYWKRWRDTRNRPRLELFPRPVWVTRARRFDSEVSLFKFINTLIADLAVTLALSHVVAVGVLISLGAVRVKFAFFFFLAGIAALTALLLRTQKKHMQLLLDQRDDVLTFRPDGMLVVERPSGETLTFPIASEVQVPFERGFRRYSNGAETYVTCLAMLEPVEGPEEAEVVSHA